MASLAQSEKYPASFFLTAKIEKEIADVELEYNKMILLAEMIGFKSMTAWQGRMHEFVNRPQVQRH